MLDVAGLSYDAFNEGWKARAWAHELMERYHYILKWVERFKIKELFSKSEILDMTFGGERHFKTPFEKETLDYLKKFMCMDFILKDPLTKRFGGYRDEMRDAIIANPELYGFVHSFWFSFFPTTVSIKGDGGIIFSRVFVVDTSLPTYKTYDRDSLKTDLLSGDFNKVLEYCRANKVNIQIKEPVKFSLEEFTPTTMFERRVPAKFVDGTGVVLSPLIIYHEFHDKYRHFDVRSSHFPSVPNILPSEKNLSFISRGSAASVLESQLKSVITYTKNFKLIDGKPLLTTVMTRE
jgi:hypothetical protein